MLFSLFLVLDMWDSVHILSYFIMNILCTLMSVINIYYIRYNYFGNPSSVPVCLQNHPDYAHCG